MISSIVHVDILGKALKKTGLLAQPKGRRGMNGGGLGAKPLLTGFILLL